MDIKLWLIAYIDKERTTLVPKLHQREPTGLVATWPQDVQIIDITAKEDDDVIRSAVW
jgi:hypothetical protein